MESEYYSLMYILSLCSLKKFCRDRNISFYRINSLDASNSYDNINTHDADDISFDSWKNFSEDNIECIQENRGNYSSLQETSSIKHIVFVIV